MGCGSVAEPTASPCSTGHAQGQVWGGGGHAADEAGDGGWEDGSRRLPCQVHSAPPHWGQVVGRVCSIPAHVAGVYQRLLCVGGLSGGEQHPSADYVCFAGASTPHMTTHTASATPSRTSPTPSAPRSSRPGEHRAWHGLGWQLSGGAAAKVLRGCGAVSVPPLQTFLLLLALQCTRCLLPCAVGVRAPEPALHCRLQEENHPAGGDGCCEVGAEPAARVGPGWVTPGCHTHVFSGTGMTRGSSR